LFSIGQFVSLLSGHQSQLLLVMAMRRSSVSLRCCVLELVAVGTLPLEIPVCGIRRLDRQDVEG